jgi:hypothetical protein
VYWAALYGTTAGRVEVTLFYALQVACAVAIVCAFAKAKQTEERRRTTLWPADSSDWIHLTSGEKVAALVEVLVRKPTSLITAPFFFVREHTPRELAHNVRVLREIQKWADPTVAAKLGTALDAFERANVAAHDADLSIYFSFIEYRILYARLRAALGNARARSVGAD